LKTNRLIKDLNVISLIECFILFYFLLNRTNSAKYYFQ
jgi:hypothetical protein